MNDQSRAFYAEALKNALIDKSYEITGHLFQMGGKYQVEFAIDLLSYAPDDNPHYQNAFVAINETLSAAQHWGKAKVSPKLSYQPYCLKVAVSFPVPIPEERYFDTMARKPFLHNYAIFLIALALAEEFSRQGSFKSCAELRDAFPNPRHPKDLAREQFRQAWAQRVSRALTFIKPKMRDKFRAYR